MIFHVKLEDTDTLGVIYGPRICVWTSRILQRSFKSHGISLQNLIESKVHLPIFRSSSEIRLPLRLGDRIEAKLQITERKERSFAFAVDFLLEGEFAARGEMVHVCIDATTREKKPLPKSITAWLDALKRADSA